MRYVYLGKECVGTGGLTGFVSLEKLTHREIFTPKSVIYEACHSIDWTRFSCPLSMQYL